MAALNETSTWESEIYQIEVLDRVSGGPDGVANIQPRQLANRSKWLKDQVSTLSSQVATKAPINNPAFTGTVTGITASMIGLGNVSNVPDNEKVVYAASRLSTGRKINGVTFDGTSDITVYDNTKAPTDNPTFSGIITFSAGSSVSGFTKAMIGLGNVDNTADNVKNVLSATKLTTPRTINGVSFDGTSNITIYDNTKSPTSNPTFSGTVTLTGCTIVGLLKSSVGLGNVDNTADAVKNVLSATKLTTARTINGVSFDGTANITIYDTTKEPAFTKNTAFNKNFGTTSGTVCQGNDSRLSDARTPVAHKMSSATYHSGFTLSSSTPSGGSEGDLWFKYVA